MKSSLALMEKASEATSGHQDALQDDLGTQRPPFCPAVYDGLSDRHRRVARLIGFGFSDLTIAEACNLQPRAVSEIRKRPEVQAYVLRLKDLARLELLEQKDHFDELLLKSIQVYEDILNDPEASPHLRFKVACQVLDRHPDGQFVRGQKTTHVARPVMDGKAIERLKMTAASNNDEL